MRLHYLWVYNETHDPLPFFGYSLQCIRLSSFFASCTTPHTPFDTPTRDPAGVSMLSHSETKKKSETYFWK